MGARRQPAAMLMECGEDRNVCCLSLWWYVPMGGDAYCGFILIVSISMAIFMILEILRMSSRTIAISLVSPLYVWKSIFKNRTFMNTSRYCVACHFCPIHRYLSNTYLAGQWRMLNETKSDACSHEVAR